MGLEFKKESDERECWTKNHIFFHMQVNVYIFWKSLIPTWQMANDKPQLIPVSQLDLLMHLLHPDQWLTSIEPVLELADLVLESVNSNAEPMSDLAKIGKWLWALVSNLQKPSISLCEITGSRSGLT